MIARKIVVLMVCGLVTSIINLGDSAYAEGGAPLKAPVLGAIEYRYNADGTMQVISASVNTMKYLYDPNGNLVQIIAQ